MDQQPALPFSAPRSNLASADSSAYTPRCPEDTLLYGVVADNLESFLAEAERADRVVPRFVEREFRTYLECGILARGFLRVHCDACGKDRFVAFSCKGRGFCPSCGGRRMADTAAHLVDRVLPRVPVRQWVLTLPFSLRFRLAYDARLTSEILRLFIRVLFASLRRRARRRFGLSDPRCGAVTVVQRFGDALNLNLHFHTLVLDGVYVRNAAHEIRFRPLPPPDDDEVARIAVTIARRLARLLERRGLGRDDPIVEVDPFCQDQPLLASLYGASVRQRVATGPRRGQRVERLGDRIDAEDVAVSPGSRCASVAGVNLHANVCVPANDRSRLERLCRYVARPPIATERLEQRSDGQLLYRLKHRWRDGTTHMVFTPMELMEKLAALVPAPRVNLIRYHGVLAPRSAWRDAVVPAVREAVAASPAACCASGQATPCADEKASADQRSPSLTSPFRLSPSRYYSWPELMRRVFALEVLQCPDCHGPMRILAAIHPPEATRAILEHLGLPSRDPPIAAARADEEFPSNEFGPEYAGPLET